MVKKYFVKLVDTNGVVSDDKVFLSRAEAEVYRFEQEKNSNGWELHIFEYPLTSSLN